MFRGATALEEVSTGSWIDGVESRDLTYCSYYGTSSTEVIPYMRCLCDGEICRAVVEV